MKKVKLSSVLAGALITLCASNGWADSVESVLFDGDTQSVTVAGTFDGCYDKDIVSVGTLLEDMYFLQLFTTPQSDPVPVCTDDMVAFSYTTTVPPEITESQIIVGLYSGLTGTPDEVVFSYPEEPVELTCEESCTDANDSCLSACDETDFSLGCSADCVDADDVDTCVAECVADEFLSCQDDCNTALTMCNEECTTVEAPDAAITCTPDTLNLKSNGRWVTCVMEASDEYALEDVDLTAFTLNDTIISDMAVLQDGYIVIKFSRPALIDMISSVDDQEYPLVSDLLVSGSMIDGAAFSATDTVNVILPEANGFTYTYTYQTKNAVQEKIQPKAQKGLAKGKNK